MRTAALRRCLPRAIRWSAFLALAPWEAFRADIEAVTPDESLGRAGGISGSRAANTSKDACSDSAYRSAEAERHLKAQGLHSRIHNQGRRNRPPSEAEAAANTAKIEVRARIEHVFGARENAPGGCLVRSIGL